MVSNSPLIKTTNSKFQCHIVIPSGHLLMQDWCSVQPSAMQVSYQHPQAFSSKTIFVVYLKSTILMAYIFHAVIFAECTVEMTTLNLFVLSPFSRYNKDQLLVDMRNQMICECFEILADIPVQCFIWFWNFHTIKRPCQHLKSTPSARFSYMQP